MTKLKLLSFTLATMAALAVNSIAQDTTTKSTNAPAAKPRTKQGDVASATAKFGKIAKTDDTYKSALEAHALDDALKSVGKDGAFKGTVTRVFELRSLAILNFDANYRNALTAVVQAANFTNFPALTNLVGKEVVVTGKFTDYQGRAQIALSDPEQIKVVEAEAKQ